MSLEDSIGRQDVGFVDKKRILVVDDDESIIEFVTCLLRDEGYAVTGCTEPEEAIRVAQAWNPNLIISDLKMRMPGDQMVKKVDEYTGAKGRPLTPVVFMSASSNGNPNPARAGWLEKPFDLDELFSLVVKSLNGANSH